MNSTKGMVITNVIKYFPANFAPQLESFFKKLKLSIWGICPGAPPEAVTSTMMPMGTRLATLGQDNRYLP